MCGELRERVPPGRKRESVAPAKVVVGAARSHDNAVGADRRKRKRCAAFDARAERNGARADRERIGGRRAILDTHKQRAERAIGHKRRVVIVVCLPRFE